MKCSVNFFVYSHHPNHDGMAWSGCGHLICLCAHPDPDSEWVFLEPEALQVPHDFRTKPFFLSKLPFQFPVDLDGQTGDIGNDFAIR